MQKVRVECKPTLWFLSRALLMLFMFTGVGAYFYYDAQVGYPRKNWEYFMHRTFVEAGKLFDEKRDKVSPREWEQIVDSSKVVFPEGFTLPPDHDRNNVAWPKILGDYDLMSAVGKGWNEAWTQYSAEHRYSISPEDHPFDQSRIREQWIAGTCCFIISGFILYILVRTLRRRMIIDGDNVTLAGKNFKVADIAAIDLRKWKTKGLAFALLDAAHGDKRVRVDGLTYGGFKKSDEPNNAENWMQSVLGMFHGEIIDYEDEDSPVADENANEATQETKSEE